MSIFGRFYLFLIPSILAFTHPNFLKRSSRQIIGEIQGSFSFRTAEEDTVKAVTEVDLRAKTIIVGAGISGLACAKELIASNAENVIILESSDAAGGRVRTDEVDGFLLDRGFQVFIEEYPEAKALFDYERLDLKQFWPGAYVRYQGKFHKVSDPFRRPWDLLASAFTPIGTLIDKIRVGVFSLIVRTTELDEIFSREEDDTETYLRESQCLSPAMIERFFSPFYQGIFLSPLKYQSSRMFEFVFKMFTEGAAALPAGGMQTICDQVAESLPSGTLQLNTKVFLADEGTVIAFNEDTGNVEKWTCDNIVVAADPPAVLGLAEAAERSIDLPESRKSTCLYYGFDGPPPISDPVLILNGENCQSDVEPSSTTINNVCFPSSVSPAYAPIGKSLASVTVVGAADGVTDDALETSVFQQLGEWFGEDTTRTWQHLRTYRIAYAQPAQTPPYSIKGLSERGASDGMFICGDHRGTATLNGAIESGRRAARSIVGTD